MQQFIEEITENWMIYGAFACLTFLNIIVPMSGSSTATPLILVLTGNPQYAIAVSSWLLMLNTAIGAFIFRVHIRKDYVLKLLPASLVGVVAGALLLLRLPDWLVISVLFAFSVHFLYKTVKHFLASKKEVKQSPPSTLIGTVATFVSSFLQGAGLSGGGMRANYLYSEGLKAEEARGTGNLLNCLVFAAAGLVRLGDGQIALPDMFRWTVIFIPILILANFLGRKVLLKLPDKLNDTVIILTMTWIVTDLFAKGVLLAL